MAKGKKNKKGKTNRGAPRLLGKRGRELRKRRNARKRDRALARLQRDGDPSAAAIGRALAGAIEKRTSPEEKAWIERIEGLREELKRSDEVIRTSHVEWTASDADREKYRVKTLPELATRASKPPKWGLVMLRLVREMRPEHCLEFGTCLGLSAAYQAAALDLNGGAKKFVTLEADSNRARVARRNFEKLGLEWVDLRLGRFQDTLEPVLEEQEPIHFAFIDGHHQEGPTIEYFGRVADRAGRPAVLLFDDITWSDGMKKAWRTIRRDRRVGLAIDLGGVGLCLVGDGDGGRRSVSCPLFA